MECNQSARADDLSLLLALAKRREARTAIRHNVVTYKAESDGCDWAGWLRTALSLRGRPVMHMLPPLLAVALMTAVRIVATETNVLFGRWILSEFKGDLNSLLMVPLSFLLVYRLNRSAVRFYDARAAAGKMIETCRILAGEAVTLCAYDVQARDELCRWLVAFPCATRNFLRAEAPEPLLELAGILSNAQAQGLQGAKVQTLFCCDRLRQAALRATRSNTLDHPAIAAAYWQKMEDQICILTGAMGAMERINNTPLPFAYVAHLRSCLLFYLLFLPWTLDFRDSWITVPLLLLVCFSLLGVESAAVACERPFRDQQNHLPFDQFVDVVAENVYQILQSVENSECASMESSDRGCSRVQMAVPEGCTKRATSSGEIFSARSLTEVL